MGGNGNDLYSGDEAGAEVVFGRSDRARPVWRWHDTCRRNACHLGNVAFALHDQGIPYESRGDSRLESWTSQGESTILVGLFSIRI